MRRLLALGLGCLASFTASSEDLLTIFDQAVVNDPLVREAEFTRKATREARPQAWAAYLPQISGQLQQERRRGQSAPTPAQQLIDDPTDPPEPFRPRSIFAQTGSGDSTTDTIRLGGAAAPDHLQLGPARRAASRPARIAAQADADYGVAQQDLALRVVHALLRRARRAGQRAGTAGLARRHFAPARAGRQALRSRPHRHHRRAGSARRARHRRRGSHRREASARHLAGVAARDHRHAVPGARHAARHHAARDPRAGRSAEVGRGVDGAEPRADLEPPRRGHRAR